MASRPGDRVFISHAAGSVHALNEETVRRLSALIEANTGPVIKGEIPMIREGVLGHLSDDAREAVEAQMRATAQTLSTRLPQVVEGTVNLEMPKHVVARIEGLDAIPVESARVRRDLFRAFEEATPVAPSEPAVGSGKRKQVRRVSTPERIATRVINRQRQNVLSLLKLKRFAPELKELKELEVGLRRGTKRSCKHAAFNARNLMEGLADHLYPPVPESRRSRTTETHSLGPGDHKNRLIAYVEERLEGKLESHDFKSFISTMDTVFRWTGSGPHGTYDREEAEHVYPRLLEALSVIARAYRA